MFPILCKPETLLAAFCFSGKWREKDCTVTDDRLPAEGHAHWFAYRVGTGRYL